ncbi:TauD/TfdA family dioxygenase [Streptomyces sp. UNOC14_S4]|uniref:TauD/TfdA family dioxygenase n=1 Tax=Streptomyces sp. UNOC14_S4 TaxID=2872340 RepID=UPI001E52BAEA|nr:TauD/TfdA family dioxygenase [Streptomyces sp. UNOC14_S4]MCC3768872.1 TauD/TfdA family dioxygenase [Streptomyces sp. UNOC14_S4]
MDSQSIFVLTDEERARVGEVADLLAAAQPAEIDHPDWMSAGRDLSVTLPARLAARIRQYRHDPGPDGSLLIRNLPVREAELPDTPQVLGSVEKVPGHSSSVITLTTLQLGEIIAYRNEKSGALVQNVVPVPGQEAEQNNAGSKRLGMHVENTFHDNRPDYVALFCVRADHDRVAELQVTSVRRALALLSETDRAVLAEPRYVTPPPSSFPTRTASEPHALLIGAEDDPNVRADFISTEPLDEEAGRAKDALEEAFAKVVQGIKLVPGDLAIVNNHLVLHGRSHFTPRYDGKDRWLHRTFVQLDHRRSRAVRQGNGNVLD